MDILKKHMEAAFELPRWNHLGKDRETRSRKLEHQLEFLQPAQPSPELCDVNRTLNDQASRIRGYDATQIEDDFPVSTDEKGRRENDGLNSFASRSSDTTHDTLDRYAPWGMSDGTSTEVAQGSPRYTYIIFRADTAITWPRSTNPWHCQPCQRC